ncbi:N-acetylmuramic acid 6-phosphate etherase [Methylocapsa sp. S129]|uniref:N-acetylmuramic acid 6-phosphate etherase n=1 Tax=Methylocapsa sp. S129 TaxID=1641869 RepID=UPI00131DEF40|nr:N-acetylmuramic acid 6-phosphate etherase [Methylocapsa sp. S129]
MATPSDDKDQGQFDAPFLAALLESQKRAVDSVAACAEAIERAAETISDRLRAGGRLVYIGAGSSGLIALQDGAELPGTFGLDIERIVFLIAGGMAEIARIDSAAEDDIGGASADIAALGPMERDIVIAISASGSTPYTLARAKAARERGASVIALANRAASPLLHIADHPILLDSGAEALHGSTRLAAGTAQKCALGLLSTMANARLGHVFRGHMVNVRPENEKLRRRAVHIIASVAGVDEDAASASLGRAKGDVKCAIVIASGAATREQAQDMIHQAGGHVGAALARLHPGAASF